MTSVKRNVDREGWGSGIYPTPGIQIVKRPISTTIALTIAATSTVTLNVKRSGITVPFTVHGPANQLWLQMPGVNGGSPPLHSYRLGFQHREHLLTRPYALGSSCVTRRMMWLLPTSPHGHSGIMDSTRPKRFQQHSYSPRKLARYRGFVASLDRFQGSEFITSSPTRLPVGSSPRGSYRRREGFDSRASYLPHYREYQNRNVSHLNLLSGSAPTPPSVVTNMTGRFFRCQNSLLDFWKKILGTEK